MAHTLTDDYLVWGGSTEPGEDRGQYVYELDSGKLWNVDDSSRYSVISAAGSHIARADIPPGKRSAEWVVTRW